MDKVMLGQNIRTLRLNKTLTMEQLAEESGLSLDTIWQLENGRTAPSLNTLVKLCDALDTSPSLLLGSDVPNVIIKSEYSSVFEDILKLTPGEFERITDIVDIILEEKPKRKN